MKSLGLCLGASTVTLAAVEVAGGITHITHTDSRVHDGDVRLAVQTLLADLHSVKWDRVALTGRKFRHRLRLSSITEPLAVEYAFRFTRGPDLDCPTVVSAGGETFMVYTLNTKGHITNVVTGNKCASGTGEFFLQQLRRMDVSLAQAGRWAQACDPHPVSGRCSVFCKSDCTHATNKGISKASVTAGLCKMMADKILGLLKKTSHRRVMITGGVTQNRMIMDYLREHISGLVVPPTAPVFEALGAALWACDHPTQPLPPPEDLFTTGRPVFALHPPLNDFVDRVSFRQMPKGVIRTGDCCILGLDVGSTTTKAVLIRKTDHALLASVYLRTHGDPVAAARSCYRGIDDVVRQSVDPDTVTIEALGVCGSGRQIASLHALTDGVTNEILAHATAAAYFDPDVDTLFEIGGQDAKYTFLTHSIASDYAMNEACAAGTGSFLEESALESLGVAMDDIADGAFLGARPPNFNDQCSAFIASDMKTAIADGASREDILAGLVYSVCLNYINRVKGSRPTGQKIFMQGGVCYNRAVPVAMAALTGQSITVPPHPGLMGAFGAALVVKKRMEQGLLEAGRFDLDALAEREARYGKSFTCHGAAEQCDRRCTIAVMEIDSKKFPFGGACNKYENLRHDTHPDSVSSDTVSHRQSRIFEQPPAYEPSVVRTIRGRVGINRSFLTHSYYPLYSGFFEALGFETVLPDQPAPAGMEAREAAFCYPMELAHGFFHELLHGETSPDYLFMPHVKALPNLDGAPDSQTCPLVQGEPYALRAAFADPIASAREKGMKILTPVIDLSCGLESMEVPLLECAQIMGIGKSQGLRAFKKALERQAQCACDLQQIGREALKKLDDNPDEIAVVILGRPYAGFAPEANKGIPRMLATRGVRVIPMDCLPSAPEPAHPHMYWGTGRQILNAATFVLNHPRLFAVYITHFSCGPDSFLIPFMRDIMGPKPSLTLELDSHTAGAGLETRIEAFLDVVAAYRLQHPPDTSATKSAFVPARMLYADSRAVIRTSGGHTHDLRDPRVRILIPSMGDVAAKMLAAVFESRGMKTWVHPPADDATLKIGRAHTTGKECLPLILTTGSLIHYAQNVRQADEVTAFFMPTGAGPCRFGQYAVFMDNLIKKLKLPDVAILSISSANAYAGLDGAFRLRAWWAAVISDGLEDIRGLILAVAKNRQAALEEFDRQSAKLIAAIRDLPFDKLTQELQDALQVLKNLPGVADRSANPPVIAIVGEIFVRRDDLSRQNLTKQLADEGFAVICAPVGEWIAYTHYLVRRNLVRHRMSAWQKLKLTAVDLYVAHYTRKLQGILHDSGLMLSHPVDVDDVMRHATPFISPHLTGEASLTVGSALCEIATRVCGVISISPFGCMPGRLAESVLHQAMRAQSKLAANRNHPLLKDILRDESELPYLAIETDGSPFPQIIDAKLEAFSLRARRLDEKMRRTHTGLGS